jgi:hypothetical protein
MRRPISIVKSGRLYQSESEGDPIDVGTPAWYDWLEHHTTFTFVDRVGTVTVRKRGPNPSDLDWEASGTRMGQRLRVSLGSSRALTLSRLQDAARKLSGKHAQVGSTTQSLASPAASTFPDPTISGTGGSPISLIQTKLYRPRSVSDVIPRAHLIERLNTALGAHLARPAD